MILAREAAVKSTEFLTRVAQLAEHSEAKRRALLPGSNAKDSGCDALRLVDTRCHADHISAGIEEPGT